MGMENQGHLSNQSSGSPRAFPKGRLMLGSVYLAV